jgi:hypothetical protein
MGRYARHTMCKGICAVQIDRFHALKHLTFNTKIDQLTSDAQTLVKPLAPHRQKGQNLHQISMDPVIHLIHCYLRNETGHTNYTSNRHL